MTTSTRTSVDSVALRLKLKVTCATTTVQCILKKNSNARRKDVKPRSTVDVSTSTTTTTTDYSVGCANFKGCISVGLLQNACDSRIRTHGITLSLYY